MNNSNHIIEKVFLEVNTSNPETASSIKNNIGGFLKEELFPGLEMLFNEFGLNDSILRFDELSIDFPISKWKNFEGAKSEISKQIEEKIREQIQPFLKKQSNLPDFKNQLVHYVSDNNGIRKISDSENNESAFLFFLENAYLPWFASEKQIIEITKSENWNTSLENTFFVERLTKLFSKETSAIERFINQFPEEMVIAFLFKLNPAINNHKKQVLSLLKENDRMLNYYFKKLLFQLSLFTEQTSIVNSLQFFFLQIKKHTGLFMLETKALPGAKSPEKYNKLNESGISKSLKTVKLLRNILPENIFSNSAFLETFKIFTVKNLKKTDLHSTLADLEKIEGQDIFSDDISLKQLEKENSFFETDSEQISVQNAGLIVLHPFLKHFFINTGIADKQGNLAKENLDLAVQSLHFIATGDENIFEGNLVFEKFLCGVPLKRAIKKRSLLNEKIREEVPVLLKEVIKNWKALKNSSANDLRQMFIQREGKLIQQEKKFKLIVERKAQDVLLERLSWNISMVKLPWKKEIITVEW